MQRLPTCDMYKIYIGREAPNKKAPSEELIPPWQELELML